MNEGDTLLIISIKELFTSQTKGINIQLTEIKAQALRAEGKTEEVRKQIESLISSEVNHYRDCPINADVKDIKKTFFATIDEIEDQIKKIGYILEFKKLLQTIRFMIEWKVVFVPAFVVLCFLSVIGGVQGYEAAKSYLTEQMEMKVQVKSNTQTIDAIEKKEIKSMNK